MTILDAILAILLTMPVHHSDVTKPREEIEAHRRDVATEIHVAAKGDRQVAAALLTLARYETNLAHYVAAGCVEIPKRSPDCDKGRARSHWQIWRQGCPVGWEIPRGAPEAMQAFAHCAARLWLAAKRRCASSNRDPIAGAFAGYRSMCVWPASAKRAATFRTYLARLGG